MAASLAALSTVSLVIWQTRGVASARATLNLPFLSSQPCVMMVTLLLLLGVSLQSGAGHTRTGPERADLL
jgi:hypothetical protein